MIEVIAISGDDCKLGIDGNGRQWSSVFVFIVVVTVTMVTLMINFVESALMTIVVSSPWQASQITC